MLAKTASLGRSQRSMPPYRSSFATSQKSIVNAVRSARPLPVIQKVGSFDVYGDLSGISFCKADDRQHCSLLRRLTRGANHRISRTDNRPGFWDTTGSLPRITPSG
jgi:hypothetical protein